MSLDLRRTSKTDSQLLFEKSKAGKEGIFTPGRKFPEKDFTKLIPQELQRKESSDLPEVSEPELIRHFVNLSKKNF